MNNSSEVRKYIVHSFILLVQEPQGWLWQKMGLQSKDWVTLWVTLSHINDFMFDVLDDGVIL
jgi:hypothetical protein